MLSSKGLEFLFENQIIERTPAAVAKFFVDEKKNLSKAAIGTYLGEMWVSNQLLCLGNILHNPSKFYLLCRSKEFNMQVLGEYLKLHNFGGQDFLPALRYLMVFVDFLRYIFGIIIQFLFIF